MILIGFIVVGAAVAVGIDIGTENSGARLSVEGFGHTVSQPPWVVLVVGAVCGAAALLGLSIMAKGAAHRRRLWLERRGALRQRDQLARQLVELRADRDRAQREGAVDTAKTQPGVNASGRKALTDELSHGPGDVPVSQVPVEPSQVPVEPDPSPPEPTPADAAVGRHRHLLRR
jgi:hypothetical protein